MKGLEDIKTEVAKEYGYNSHKEAPEFIYVLNDTVAKRYARECCEDFRERIADKFDDSETQDKDIEAIRNVEIITP